MKKVMFLVVMLLVAGSCFAQLQSPPSNTVGYVKISTLPNSGFTQFGLPFKFWDVPAGTGIPSWGQESTAPSDIFGDQTGCGPVLGSADVIWRQDNGNQAYRRCTNVWTGALETNLGMVPGRAYWYINRAATPRDIVLAGEVDNSGNYGEVTMLEGAFTEISWRDSRVVPRENLNLLEEGFIGGTVQGQSDYVLEQRATANSFYYRPSLNAFQGALLAVEPGQAYWLYNRHHAGNDSWGYVYNPGGALLSNEKAPSRDDKGVSISKVNSGPVKTSKDVSGSQK